MMLSTPGSFLARGFFFGGVVAAASFSFGGMVFRGRCVVVVVIVVIVVGVCQGLVVVEYQMPDEKEKLNIIRLTVSSSCLCSCKFLSESKGVGNPFIILTEVCLRTIHPAVLYSDGIDGGRGHVVDVDLASTHEFSEFSVVRIIPPCCTFLQPGCSRHIVDI